MDYTTLGTTVVCILDIAAFLHEVVAEYPRYRHVSAHSSMRDECTVNVFGIVTWQDLGHSGYIYTKSILDSSYDGLQKGFIFDV